MLVLFELIFRKEGMGFGDVKFALMLGAWLGYLHPILVLYALILSSVVGTVVGILYFVVRRKSMPFPYGPWMAAGSLIAILWSHPILDAFFYRT